MYFYQMSTISETSKIYVYICFVKNFLYNFKHNYNNHQFVIKHYDINIKRRLLLQTTATLTAN